MLDENITSLLLWGCFWDNRIPFSWLLLSSLFSLSVLHKWTHTHTHQHTHTHTHMHAHTQLFKVKLKFLRQCVSSPSCICIWVLIPSVKSIRSQNQVRECHFQSLRQWCYTLSLLMVNISWGYRDNSSPKSKNMFSLLPVELPIHTECVNSCLTSTVEMSALLLTIPNLHISTNSVPVVDLMIKNWIWLHWSHADSHLCMVTRLAGVVW